jgi:WD40 repeat protein
VYSIAFSPSGQTLAVGLWDGTIRLWRPLPSGAAGVDSLLGAFCSIHGVGIGVSEWDQLFPADQYHRTCRS